MLWGLRPVEHQAAYGLAVDGLRRQIHLGLLLPGERMPAERKLAEEIAVSRVTLREALRILEGEGYLTVKRGATGGAFVASEADLRAMAARRLARDPAAIMRILEFREINARMAARFAAGRRTPGHVKRLRQALDALKAASTPGLLRQAETAFHLAMAEASLNPLLVKAIEDAIALAFLPLVSTDIPAAAAHAHQVHVSLFEAIERGDEAMAEAAVMAVQALDWAHVKATSRAQPPPP
jgi:DNA-binding FadR family transcriptional regulator